LLSLRVPLITIIMVIHAIDREFEDAKLKRVSDSLTYALKGSTA